MSNTDRIKRASKLVEIYDAFPTVETGAPGDQHLGDMLSDMRHFALAHGYDFERAIRVSEMHFEAERRGES